MNALNAEVSSGLAARLAGTALDADLLEALEAIVEEGMEEGVLTWEQAVRAIAKAKGEA